MPFIDIAGSQPTSAEWRRIEAALKDYFPPEMVSFRVLRDPPPSENSTQIAAYLDAEAVEDWLDYIVGPENWQFHLTTAASVGGILTAAAGELTIFGITKSNVGDSTPNESEPNKRAASDTLKRCAKTWGVFRYGYSLRNMYARVEKPGKNWILAAGEEDRLRQMLPRPRFVNINGEASSGVENQAPQYAESNSSTTNVNPTPQVQRGNPTTPAPGSALPAVNGTGLSDKQLKAIYAIARNQRRMSDVEVDQLCQEQYGVTPGHLSKAEASRFIDMLKQEQAA